MAFFTVFCLSLFAAFHASAQSTCTTLQPVFELPLDATSTVFRSTITSTSTLDCGGCSLVVSTFRATISTPVSDIPFPTHPTTHLNLPSTDYLDGRYQRQRPPQLKLRQHPQALSADQKHRLRQVVRRASSAQVPHLASRLFLQQAQPLKHSSMSSQPPSCTPNSLAMRATRRSSVVSSILHLWLRLAESLSTGPQYKRKSAPLLRLNSPVLVLAVLSSVRISWLFSTSLQRSSPCKSPAIMLVDRI